MCFWDYGSMLAPCQTERRRDPKEPGTESQTRDMSALISQFASVVGSGSIVASVLLDRRIQVPTTAPLVVEGLLLGAEHAEEMGLSGGRWSPDANHVGLDDPYRCAEGNRRRRRRSCAVPVFSSSWSR